MNQKSFPNNWTEKEVAGRAQRRVGIQDQCLLDKTFEHNGYFVEMTIYNDNSPNIKWGYRGMYGWIRIYKENTDTTTEPMVKLLYVVTVPLNDWDLSPKYIEHGLMGKLEAYIDKRKECEKLKAKRQAEQQKAVE